MKSERWDEKKYKRQQNANLTFIVYAKSGGVCNTVRVNFSWMEEIAWVSGIFAD